MPSLSSPKVFVLILNYNGRETLRQCLQSVYQLSYANFEVVLIDNASTDESLEEIKALFPRTHFVRNERNLGFAAGNNPGIRFALEKGADYVWLLNNDAFVDREALDKLVESGEHHSNVGILSPLILHATTKNIWFGKGVIDWTRMKTRHISPPTLLKPFSSEYICGCAMLVKKEVFKTVGILDEHYFLYYEDVDFSIRAARAGFVLLVIPTATVFHAEASQDNPDKVYWLVFSGLRFFHHHAPKALKPWLFAYTVARRLKNRFDLAIHATPNALNAARAYRDFVSLEKP
jgi:GT2 family glycosyltransferase